MSLSLKPDEALAIDKDRDISEVENYSNDSRIIPQKRFLSFFFPKSIPPIPNDEERVSFPFKHVNMVNRMFFMWCIPLMYVGYRRTLDRDDLYKVDGDMSVDYLTKKFESIYHKRLEDDIVKYMKKNNIEDTLENRNSLQNDPNSNFKHSNNILLKSLFLTFTKDIWFALTFKLLADITSCLNPLLIRALIAFIHTKASGKSTNLGQGVGYSIGTSILIAFTGLNQANFYHDSCLIGGQVRGLLTRVLLTKALKLNARSKHQFSEGAITSMLGGDVSRIDLACGYIFGLPMIVISIAIAIVLLVVYLGPASLSGVAVYILITFFIALTTKPLIRMRQQINIFTDSRVRYVKEVLNNMKIIKYYAWEIPYANLISDIRKNELKEMLNIQFLRNIVSAVALATTSFSAMIAFLSMFGYEGLKSAASIFSSLALFSALSLQVMLLPASVSSASDAFVACNRLQEYLLCPEIEADPEYRLDEDSTEDKDGNSLVVKNGCFEWETYNDDDDSEDEDVDDESDEKVLMSSEPNPSLSSSSSEAEKEKLAEVNVDSKPESNLYTEFKGLNNIDISIKKGEFVVITGSIGSGKSSLLSALNGQMRRVSGSIHINGSLLLCGAPWIQNATVKENITFGEELDEEKYQKVIEACSLISDFDILPAGDRTEIGERGVNLSGGQTARLNLARAVYRNRDILLLDDVLSAVDARVGKHIMENCFMGLLKDKTRVLATHQLSLVGTASRIIFLNGDGSVDVGTQEELISRNLGFRTLMEFQQEGTSKETKTSEEVDELEEGIEIFEDEEIHEQEVQLIRKQTATEVVLVKSNKTVTHEADGKLMTKEFKSVNSISMNVLSTYFKAGSGLLGVALLPILVISIAFTSFAYLFINVWLSFWSEDKFSGRSSGFYIGLYVMFVFSFVILASLEFCLIVSVCNNASQNLNIQALQKLLHVPMSFMDTTPLGRIMNRFTKDTDVLDNEISEQFRMLCYGAGNIIGIYILCIIYLPWFALTIPFVAALAFVEFSFYEASSREVIRIEGVERSLVYSNFNEVIQGADTIKMYNVQDTFLDKSNKLADRMNESYFLSNSLQRWLAVSLHGTSAIINFVVTILCVTQVFQISAASAGLVVSYTTQISMLLITTMKSATTLENCLNSVERICEYALDLPQEAAYKSNQGQGKVSPPPQWPASGKIDFDHVSLRYRPGLPHVLSDIDLNIKPMEKIGICGRTGAGKSSIMTALYRLSEIDANEGTIRIDDVDISEIGLHDLRSKLSIIPQAPILFRGTIRNNLDPFGSVSDALLYDALRRSGIIDDVNNVDPAHKFHLDKTVEDDGINFSLGERQLLSLARALVRNSKILIMDEATSSVDYETDSKIQDTIKNEFSDCTILCIAHRLKTILNYDRIMVLDKGRVVQFGTPIELFKQEDGIFRSMCDRSKINQHDF